MRGRRLREGAGLALLNVFFIALCFVTLIPILYALSVSLNGQNSLLSSDFSFIPKDFTLDNYLAVFTGEDILTWFGNSILLAAATVAVSLAGGGAGGLRVFRPCDGGCLAGGGGACGLLLFAPELPGAAVGAALAGAAQQLPGDIEHVRGLPPAPADGPD